MTNAESKQQYEGAILNQLIKNSERLVLVETTVNGLENKVSDLETKIDKIYSALGLLKWIAGGVMTVFLSVVGSFVYMFLHT